MQVLKKFASHFLGNLSLYLFVFLVIFTFDRYHRWQTTRNEKLGPFVDDVAEYYAHLPDIFLGQESHQPENPAGVIYSERRTLGMAIMYCPFFFMGDQVAGYIGEPRNGYSHPYQRWLHFGTLLYALLGLWFCRKALLIFFNDTVTFLSLLSIFMGTNLFFYVYGMGEMVHSYLFFLYAVFIFASLKWSRESKQVYLPVMGIALGLISLIRPTDILIGILPLLYAVRSRRDMLHRMQLLLEKKRAFLPALLLFLIPWIIQIAWWKSKTGVYLYDTYPGEHFFFGDPQIRNFLFSFRKGWLTYTPIMVFSLIGLVLMIRKHKEFLVPITIYLVVTIYLLSAWWDWSYGGSFGNRAMIQSYALLIFPFATFIEYVWNKIRTSSFALYAVRSLLCVVLFLFIKLNLFQSWQYKFEIIHWSGMNKEAYEYVFLKESLTPEEFKVFHSKLTPPDYAKMVKGERD